jgi:hypothetical protein
MWMLGPLGFTAPWLLLGLIALPVLWILLRAVPPAPVRRLFPGIVLLLGLKDEEHEADRTPWWLLLIRTLAVAAVIVAFAGPVLNPDRKAGGIGPLLILADGTWADADDWPRRIERIGAALDEAEQAGRSVAVLTLTDLPEGALPFQAAEAWKQRLAGLQPKPWAASAEALAGWQNGWQPGGFDTLWLSDGLDRPGHADLLAALEARGTVRVFESPRPVLALLPPVFDGGEIGLTARRSRPDAPQDVTVTARGPGPTGAETELSRVTFGFEAGSAEAKVQLALQPELRNRITRFEIAGERSAGAVSLTDDTLKRREVAIIAGADDREGLELLSPTHYLHQALAPTADLIEGTLGDVLLANPDAIILADVAQLAEGEAGPLLDWVEKGGLLVRFAGPRLAASDVSRDQEDPLLPVRLRVGGRSVGGAMSWGEPKALAPFPEGSPFFGLQVPADVTVSSQVLAQPDPDLSGRVIAALADGTPLVTRKPAGQGQVVLFHVTANAEWSTLPLSGLFVQMLERLAVSSRPVRPTAAELAGTVWVPEDLIDAFGRTYDAGNLPGIAGEDLASARPGPATPPGLYAGEDRRIALNVAASDTELTPVVWPARIVVEGLTVLRSLPLKGWLLALALALLAADVIASLALAGRLRGPRAIAAALALALVGLSPGGAVRAQSMSAGDFALAATERVVFGHVLTGDAALDDLAQAGLVGLSEALFLRTSVEPGTPLAVNLETDELSFFPILYWPVSVTQKVPSSEAYAKLNRYLRAGGMILFDTRDGNIAGFGTATPEGRQLQVLAAPLDIPPLEPLPPDHVLTRSFYLLQDFPGRHTSRDLWVEASPADAEKVEGMPFRNLNDGVTPVVIGGNDWASAWAVDPRGNWLVPVGRGYVGERQREMSIRFGVNLIMHVLTGNYKSDQVHVPALLERLGQ